MQRVIRPANDAIHSVKENAPPKVGAFFAITEKYGHIYGRKRKHGEMRAWLSKKEEK